MKKYLPTTIMIIGCLVLFTGILRLLGFIPDIIATDKVFLAVVFMGMTICCVGMTLEAKFEVAYSREFQRRRRVRIRSSILASSLSFLLTLLVLIYM